MFKSFSFEEAVSKSGYTRSKNKKRIEQDDTHWNDKFSRVGLSSDGVAIVYSFPGLLLVPEEVGSTSYCRSFFPIDILSEVLVRSPYENGSKC